MKGQRGGINKRSSGSSPGPVAKARGLTVLLALALAVAGTMLTAAGLSIAHAGDRTLSGVVDVVERPTSTPTNFTLAVAMTGGDRLGSPEVAQPSAVENVSRGPTSQPLGRAASQPGALPATGGDLGGHGLAYATMLLALIGFAIAGVKIARNGRGSSPASTRRGIGRLIPSRRRDGKRAELPSIWRTIGRLRRFVVPHWRSVTVALFLLLGKAGLDLLKPWPLKFILDDVLQKGALEGSTLNLLIAVTSLVVAIALFAGLLTYLGAFLLNRAGRRIVADLRVALFDHIQRLSLQFHSRRATGDLLTRVTSDVKALKDVLTDHLAEVVYSVLFLIGMAGALLWLDWQLSLVAIGAGPLLFLALFKFTSEIQYHSRAEKKREGALASVMHEALATTRLSRVFNREDVTRERFQAESLASLESGLSATLTGERFSWLVDVVGAMITAAVLGFGAHRVMEGALTVGSLVVFISYVRDFYKPIKTAIKHANKITSSSASAERVVEILDMKEGVADRLDAVHAPSFQGTIEFRDVTFSYEAGRPALNGLNLTVPAGNMTAIVGPTGAGKTTLTSLIPRLYDPTEGAVLIDGRDIRDYTLVSLRWQISMVFQESVLLQASIAENIGYGRPSSTFEDVVAAAKEANAHDFIMALPEGYDTDVGERGGTLSGGQRQLIAIARAMVRDATIVILDEPLSGLDAASAESVMEALERLMRGRTAIMVTHQLSIVQGADHLVVMEDGQIAQQGTHRELVATNGRYRELFETQFRDILAPRP